MDSAGSAGVDHFVVAAWPARRRRHRGPVAREGSFVASVRYGGSFGNRNAGMGARSPAAMPVAWAAGSPDARASVAQEFLCKPTWRWNGWRGLRRTDGRAAAPALVCRRNGGFSGAAVRPSTAIWWWWIWWWWIWWVRWLRRIGGFGRGRYGFGGGRVVVAVRIRRLQVRWLWRIHWVRRIRWRLRRIQWIRRSYGGYGGMDAVRASTRTEQATTRMPVSAPRRSMRMPL